MSLHFHQPNYACQKCEALFIPYQTNIPCPQCGHISNIDIEEYADTIQLIAGSMRLHKMKTGYYFPGVWATMCLLDHIQSIIFRTFDAMEDMKPENEKVFLAEVLKNKFKWGDQEYLEAHIREIAFEVLKVYKDENFSALTKIERHQTMLQKIHSWFNGL